MTIEERVTNLETLARQQGQEISNTSDYIPRVGALLTEAVERLVSIEDKIDGIESRMDRFEARMDRFETRMDRFETRMDRFEARLTNVETDMALIKGWLGPQSGDSTGI